MLFLKYLFLIAGFVLFGTSATLVGYDVYLASELRRLLGRGQERPEPVTRRPIRWQLAGKLLAIGLLPVLLGLSIVVVPSGTAGVRVSQISGVRPGTLYPGVHFVTPLVQNVALYDIREQVFATSPRGGKGKAPELSVETQEGLCLGLTVIVRYRLDPRWLDYVQSNLSEPISDQIVAPVVASAFRDAAPNYLVREAFSTKREEFRQLAAG